MIASDNTVTIGVDELRLMIAETVEAAVGVRRSVNPANVIASISGQFFRWNESHVAPRTAADYRRHLKRFVEAFGDRDLVSLTPLEISEFVASVPKWGARTQNNVITAIVRMRNWAVTMQVIDAPALRGIPRPIIDPSEVFATQQEIMNIRMNSCPEFGRLVGYVWLTGCRPFEATRLRVEHIQFETSSVCFSRRESKGRRRQRRVVLTPAAMQIVRDAIGERTDLSEHVFLNTDGRPWNKDSTRQHFARLERREVLTRRLTMYSIRHGFAVDCVQSRADTSVIAAVMGHVDSKMIETVYGHFDQQSDVMREALAKRATSVSVPEGAIGLVRKYA